VFFCSCLCPSVSKIRELTLATELDRWVLSQRSPRNVVDPSRPYAFFNEAEPDTGGKAVDIATLFLTNRECPFRCVMCDLWQNTLTETVPPGAIPAQIDHALERLGPARWLKLYNAGSFFDPRAIPEVDYPAIAERCREFERMIVECHPAFIGERTLRFRDLIGNADLEIAMGLETAHPEVLARLNKRMTLPQFREAARFLRSEDIDVRSFILVRPPWLTEAEGLEWACRSLDFAFESGVQTCTLIPTRGGNGAIEALAEVGEYAPPSLRTLERAMEYGLSLNAGRVFADLWDVDRFRRCRSCDDRRISRLQSMNSGQALLADVGCMECA
jgi:radical SAM enzyme (TIGR01210 family)